MMKPQDAPTVSIAHHPDDIEKAVARAPGEAFRRDPHAHPSDAFS